MTPGPNRNEHLSYRPDIDGLRALAILSVLGFHAFPAWVPGGFIGVDVFFVISGYLISGILLANLEKGRFSLSDFYTRRIRRIFPALIVVLVATLTTGFFVLWPGEYRHLAEHAAGGVGFVVNILLSDESGYFAEHIEAQPLLHLWSLGVEEQFYIVWPLMLAVAWKWKKKVGLVIILVILVSFAANIWLAGTAPVLDFYSPFTRFWELLAGGALAWRCRCGTYLIQAHWVGEVLAILGMALIALADFCLNKNMPFPSWAALLPVGGAVLMIAAGEKAFINRKILMQPVIVGIGLISYPLYLWHWPLLSFSEIIGGEASPRTIRIAMITMAFILATLTYLYIEQPIRKKGLSQRTLVMLIMIMMCVGGTSVLIYISKGLPQRFTDPAYALSALDGDELIAAWQKNVRMGKCHLQEPADIREGNACIDEERPLLFLWGDSHAASLYPGLKKLQASHRFGIAQLTQAACPPLFDLSARNFRPNCNDINADILAQAGILKPAVIVLDSAWIHGDYQMTNADILEKVIASVARIKLVTPQSRIIVVGPEPRWLSPLPAIYRRSLTFSHTLPPARLSTHLDPRFVVLDREMRIQLSMAHIDYLSPQEYLCDVSGCLTRLDDHSGSPTFMDDEHISAPTAEFLADKFAPALLKNLQKSQE